MLFALSHDPGKDNAPQAPKSYHVLERHRTLHVPKIPLSFSLIPGVHPGKTENWEGCIRGMPPRTQKMKQMLRDVLERPLSVPGLNFRPGRNFWRGQCEDTSETKPLMLSVGTSLEWVLPPGRGEEPLTLHPS